MKELEENIGQNGSDQSRRPELNPDGFFGRRTSYSPHIEHYDKTKLAFGMWDFRIKFSGKNPASCSFAGIYRNGFMELLHHHGFYKRYRKDNSYFFLHCIDNMIEEVDTIQVSDFITDYLETEGGDISVEYQVNGEVLRFTASLQLQKETIKKQYHSLFNKEFLELLPTSETEILKDTRTECYKLFENKIFKITARGIETVDYKDLRDKWVWKKHRIPFSLEYTEDFTSGHYYKFILNVSNGTIDPERHQAFRTATGYLLHNYNHPEMGQAIMCYDEAITDDSKPEGGTGKGLFAKGIGHLSEMVTIDGKKFNSNDRFCFQLIKDSTQVVLFDDVKPKSGFDRFNSLLTDGWNIEKKNQDEFSIPPEDSPKVNITSNSILDCEGSTRKRRQSILEFSDHYSKYIKKGIEQPIKDLHGCIFFSDDWDTKEWRMFYSFQIHCIAEYMKKGLTYYEPRNVNTNRLRQTTSDDFAEWIEQQSFDLNREYETKSFYERFLAIYPDEKFHQRSFTGYLKKYAQINGWLLKTSASSGKTFFKFVK